MEKVIIEGWGGITSGGIDKSWGANSHIEGFRDIRPTPGP